MNARLVLSEIAAQIATAVPVGTHVGTCYQRDLLTAFGKTYPAVWVQAQRAQRIDDGTASAPHYHQQMKVDVAVTLVVQRYASGVYDAETAINTLHDTVVNALKNWLPSQAWTALTIESTSDGQSNESVITVDIVFSAKVLWRSS